MPDGNQTQSITEALQGVHCGLGLLMIIYGTVSPSRPPWPIFRSSHIFTATAKSSMFKKTGRNLTASRRQASICVCLDFLLHTRFFILLITLLIISGEDRLPAETRHRAPTVALGKFVFSSKLNPWRELATLKISSLFCVLSA